MGLADNWRYSWDRGEKQHVPAGGGRLGIIFCLHGLTQSTGNILRFSKMNEVGDALRCAVIYPEAANVVGNWLNTPFSVFDEKLADMKRRVDHDGRLFLAGFSNGACYVHRLGQHWQEIVSGVCIYSGALLGAAVQTTRKYPVLAIHSDDDPLVTGLEQAEVCESPAERGSMMGDLVDAYRAAGHPVEYVQLATGGHVWQAGMANPHILRAWQACAMGG